jgi:hypothetical protein
MKILIISEPRTGSYNLLKWFMLDDRFTVFRNTLKLNENKIEKSYEYNSEHLIVCSYPNGVDDYLPESLSFFDKIVCLHRENFQKQLQSYMNAVSEFNWDSEYFYKDIHIKKEEIFIKKIKNKFNSNYLKNYFSISYEDLYEKNNINKLLDYIKIDSEYLDRFPFGRKYRVDMVNGKII